MKKINFKKVACAVLNTHLQCLERSKKLKVLQRYNQVVAKRQQTNIFIT